MKRPSFQFYPGDWLKDPALRSCSPAARGVWIDLVCLLHEMPQRGVFRNGKESPWSAKKCAQLVIGARSAHVTELVSKGVLAVARSDGALYSKRMVRDELKRRHRQQAGQKGGWQKASNRLAKGKQNPSSRARPSSSSSSSTSTSVSTDKQTAPVLVAEAASEEEPRRKQTKGSEAFEAWWDQYPKAGKASKKKAWDVWRKDGLETAATEIMAGLAEWHKSERWLDGKIVNAKQWLDEERWLNPPPAPTPGGNGRADPNTIVGRNSTLNKARRQPQDEYKSIKLVPDPPAEGAASA